MSVDADPSVFRLDDKSIQENPFAHYFALREQAPVLQTELAGHAVWVLSRQEDIATALKDSATFSSRTSPQPTLLHSDPPEQQRLRAMMSGLFTRSAVSSMEPFIQQRSSELLDELVPAGGCDIVDDFAGPLTVSVSARLFGISVDDVEQLRHWSKINAEYVRATRLGISAPEEAKTAHAELFAFAGSLMAPGNHRSEGAVAALAKLTAAGELTQEEFSRFVVLLLVAGHSTTTNLITNATYTVTQLPENIARLRDESAFAQKFIEEVLRVRPSFQRIPRVTTREVEVSGTTIPANSTVYLLLGSANRDPRVFDEPEAFDPDQRRKMHMSFGHGIHTCLGQWLARMEGRIALQSLVTRVESVALDPEQPPDHLSGGTFNEFGFHHLPVRFVPLAR